jgi:diguanylate cyclase (GGDEF)-like protein
MTAPVTAGDRSAGRGAAADEGSLVLRWVEALSPWTTATLVVLGIVAMAAADWCSSADVGFTLGYLLPVALAAWRLPQPWVSLTAISCAVAWALVHSCETDGQLAAAVVAVNVGMEVLVFLSFGLLLSTLRHRLYRERWLANTDALTGVANRRAFESELLREMERCRRFQQPFTLAYLDIDGFKQVNDQLGHRAGDDLLRSLARTLRQGVRSVDLVARLGGDEFVVLMPATDGFGALVVVQRLQQEIADFSRMFNTGVTIGCLTVLREPPPLDELVARADRLLYEQKQNGRGRVCHQVLPEPMAGASMTGSRSVAEAGASSAPAVAPR